jgi:hypothetical protein
VSDHIHDSRPSDRERELPDRWALSPGATAFVRERADRLKTDPAIILEDLVLVERRRVEGSI